MLGCGNCVDKTLCGGLRIANGGFDAIDCMSMCRCDDREKCALVCPNAPRRYIRRVREVAGFDLLRIPVAKPHRVPALPDIALLVEGDVGESPGSKTLPYVAIPLSMTVVGRGTSTRPKTRRELERTFGMSPRHGWIATGVERDPRVERMWRLPSPARTYAHLHRRAGVIFATTPNFSTPANVPRHDNMHAMMRIAWTWYEMVTAGLPAALHLNGRTDHDFYRWAEFARRQPALKAVAFEFLTGAEPKKDGRRYVARLERFVQDSGRDDLLLVLRGDAVWLHELKEAFPRTLLIDSGPFFKAVNRRRLVIGPGGRPSYQPHKTSSRSELNALFRHNAHAKLSLHGGNFLPGHAIQTGLALDAKAKPREAVSATLETNPQQFKLFVE